MNSSGDKDLFKLLGKFEHEQKMPPVQDWKPEIVNDIDIVIDQQGRWFHEGGHFDRQDLARMFASILRREGEDYFLVTPTEKLKITVKDVPFSIVLMKSETIDNQQKLTFITSLGDEVVANDKNKLEFRVNEAGDNIPYIEVRNRLWGKLNQSTYYELVSLAEERSNGFFLTSCDSEVKIPS